MAIDYAVLKTECQTDPTGIGLAVWFAQGADGRVAELLNTVRSTINIGRSDVTQREVSDAIDFADIDTIANVNSALAARVPSVGPISELWAGSCFESLMQSPTMILRQPNAQNTGLVDSRALSNIKLLMKNGSGTETRLRNLGQRKGSRAEQLFGENTVITAGDVATARG